MITALSANADSLVTGSSDGMIIFHRLPALPAVYVRGLFHKGAVSALVIKDNLLISGGIDGVVCVWRLIDGALLYTLPQPLENPVLSLALAPDGDALAVGHASSIRIWTFLWTYGVQAVPEALAVTEPARWLLWREHVVIAPAQSWDVVRWIAQPALTFEPIVTANMLAQHPQSDMVAVAGRGIYQLTTGLLIQPLEKQTTVVGWQASGTLWVSDGEGLCRVTL